MSTIVVSCSFVLFDELIKSDVLDQKSASFVVQYKLMASLLDSVDTEFKSCSY